MAHDVRAEDLSGFGFHDDLRDAGGVLHRPAVGHVAVVLHLRPDVESLCAGLVFGEADHGDLRVGENRRRHVAVVGLHQGVGVVPIQQQILPDHARLVVGHMLELVVRAHVAERENATRGGALVLVDRRHGRRAPRRPPTPRRAGRRWESGRSPPAPCRRAPSRRCPVVNVMPVPSWLAPTTLRWLWISHFLDAMSVNRSHTVSSQCRSNVPPRMTSVTRVPSAEKVCANSAATKPPPTMIRCFGSSPIRMMVSLVW